MGADWYARAVLGCEVTGKLYRIELKPSCAHAFDRTAFKFCPHCGKDSRDVENEVPIAGYDPDEGVINTRSGPVRVAWTTDQKRMFAGFVAKADDHYSDGASMMPSSPGLVAPADWVREALEPLGLWDPATFGLWALLYCSY